jgi:hypothetical protein
MVGVQFVEKEKTFVLGKHLDRVPVVQIDRGEIPTVIFCFVDPANFTPSLGVGIHYQGR